MSYRSTSKKGIELNSIKIEIIYITYNIKIQNVKDPRMIFATYGISPLPTVISPHKSFVPFISL